MNPEKTIRMIRMKCVNFVNKNCFIGVGANTCDFSLFLFFLLSVANNFFCHQTFFKSHSFDISEK